MPSRYPLFMNKTDKIALIGYGVEGQAVASYLYAQDYKDVTILDDKEVTPKEPYLAVCGKNAMSHLMNFDIAFRTPGVSLLRPELVEAAEHGVKITSQTELFLELCRGITIGVTGTKGKTTTSTFLHHLLTAAGKKSVLVGNVGIQMLSQLSEIDEETYVIMELSSFQLHDLPTSPHIAMVLGITPEHLDYHKDFDEYVEAKSSIVIHQGISDIKIVDVDNEISRAFENIGSAQAYQVSKKEPVSYGIGVQDEHVIFCEDGEYEALVDLKDIPAKAPELRINFLMGLTLGYILGITKEVMRDALLSYKGVPYRMEFVRKVGEVSFWNDSAGTTPESAMAAIHSFSEPMMLLLGGGEKNVAFEGLVDELFRSSHLRKVVTIGEKAGRRLYDVIEARGETPFGLKHVKDFSSLPKIFAEVVASSEIKHVVLSPACSSLDQFQNYKERGDLFVRMVGEL